MNVLVLTSGGVDSLAMLFYYKQKGYNCHSLFIDYGQLARKREQSSFRKICDMLDIKHQYEVTSSNIVNYNTGYHRGRNAFLILVGLMNLPFESGIIAIGIHDDSQYVDCNSLFSNKMQDLLDVYESGVVLLETPFVHWNKSEILSYCRLNGLPLQLTYSCESGDEHPCGNCLSCKDIEGEMF